MIWCLPSKIVTKSILGKIDSKACNLYTYSFYLCHMLKDIVTESLPGVAVAVIRELNDSKDWEWNVYAINYSKAHLSGVLVSSKGYGWHEGEEVKTSTLRHFLDQLPPLSYIKIEPIQEDVFKLNNEYWMSYYANETMYERKYIFEPNTIAIEHLEVVSLVNELGILID
jgi:hypothetical protein